MISLFRSVYPALESVLQIAVSTQALIWFRSSRKLTSVRQNPCVKLNLPSSLIHATPLPFLGINQRNFVFLQQFHTLILLEVFYVKNKSEQIQINPNNFN